LISPERVDGHAGGSRTKVLGRFVVVLTLVLYVIYW